MTENRSHISHIETWSYWKEGRKGRELMLCRTKGQQIFLLKGEKNPCIENFNVPLDKELQDLSTVLRPVITGACVASVICFSKQDCPFFPSKVLFFFNLLVRDLLKPIPMSQKNKICSSTSTCSSYLSFLLLLPS